MNFPTKFVGTRSGKITATLLLSTFLATLSPLAFFPGSAYAGSQTFTSSGTFTVPSYLTLTVTVNGAGGGGGGGSDNATQTNGGNGGRGGNSSFNSTVVGNGGGGGVGESFGCACNSSNGSSGTASGGDTNTTGGGASGGRGGISPLYEIRFAGSGGAGGRAVKTYSAGALTPGASIPVVVGSGGSGGTSPAGVFYNGSAGSNGSVSITWTDPSAPTVTTSAASSITTSSATLNGSISATNGSDATQHGFAYSTNATLSSGVSTTTLGSKSGTGSFSETISSLNSNTTYYVRAYATNSTGTGYGSIQNFTTAAPALTINANVTVNGDLETSGALSKGSGSFVIDHPLDPKSKLLYHSFVESPDALNMYTGSVMLDERGEAHIELPSYFLALNRDFTYFATPIGDRMPNLALKKGVRKKYFGLFGPPVFSIFGGVPGGEVSWIVTGVRKDPFILANPIIPVVPKGPGAPFSKGMYVHPDVYESENEL